MQETKYNAWYFVALKLICNIVNQAFGLFPAQTRIRDRPTINALANLLCSVFDIAFDHETLYQRSNFFAVAAAVQYFVADADLFQIFLAGIGMVCIYDHSRILVILLLIQFVQCDQIFIVIVGNGSAQRVYCTAENCVCQRISRRLTSQPRYRNT